MVPRPPSGAGGDPAHHYHFVVDLLWPLWDLAVRLRGTDVGPFGVERRAPGWATLARLLPDDVELLETGSVDESPVAPLAGFNPLVVDVSPSETMTFASWVVAASGRSGREPAEGRVLMIERGHPDPHLTSLGRSSGNVRRTILNHRELAEIADALAPGRVEHVVLEELPFETQVDLFASASVVIGQHGAGLVNTLWMPPGAVLELGQLRHCHFLRIAELVGHRHHWVPMSGPIAAADPAAFERSLTAALRDADSRG